MPSDCPNKSQFCKNVNMPAMHSFLFTEVSISHGGDCYGCFFVSIEIDSTHRKNPTVIDGNQNLVFKLSINFRTFLNFRLLRGSCTNILLDEFSHFKDLSFRNIHVLKFR